MTEHIKLNPLIGRCVIFKLRDQQNTMNATILRYDKEGYWVKGGSLAAFLRSTNLSQTNNDICYIEFKKIQWLKGSPKSSK